MHPFLFGVEVEAMWHGGKKQARKKTPTCEGWRFFLFVVGRAGFEPATNGLKVRCSTS
jgi:hypothetical protein